MRFSRQEYGGGSLFPTPGDLPDPRIEPGSPTLQADSLPPKPLGKPWSGNQDPTCCTVQPKSKKRKRINRTKSKGHFKKLLCRSNQKRRKKKFEARTWDPLPECSQVDKRPLNNRIQRNYKGLQVTACMDKIQRGHRLATTGGAKAPDAYTQHRKGVDNRPPKVSRLHKPLILSSPPPS